MLVRPRSRVAIDDGRAHRLAVGGLLGRIPLAAGGQHDEPRLAVADPRERLAWRAPRLQPDRLRQPCDDSQWLGNRRAEVGEAGY